MSSSVCVIIPIYNKVPTNNEVLSISRNLLMLKQYDICFVHPRGLQLEHYYDLIKDEGNDRITFHDFDSSYFKSNKTYSRLLLSEEFYKPFMQYDYMLIAQSDTLIIGGYELSEFVDKGYDYWGAPWPDGPFCKPYTLKDCIKLLFIHHPEQLHVGNGGFSLRKISSSLELVKRKKMYIKYFWRFNEDMFFSYFAKIRFNGYTACSLEEAKKFALETNMKEEINKGNIPYAIHAFEKYLSSTEINNVLL